VLLEANGLTVSLEEVWKVFLEAAIKFRKEYNKIPVLVIDNADRLVKEEPALLKVIQNFAKVATDEEQATIVFVLDKGQVPNCMRGKLVLSIIFVFIISIIY